jgi:hypothetical protein
VNSLSSQGPSSRPYNALKVRFSATLGEEPEVEVALVRTPGWIDALASMRNCKISELGFHTQLPEGNLHVRIA